MPAPHHRSQERRRTDSRRHPHPGQPPRRRGGQPRNTNALKHGLYSAALPAAAQEALSQARSLPVTDLTEEIATLRARLSALSPYQLAAFTSGLSLLARLVAIQHRLSPSQADNLSQAVTNVVQELGFALYPPQEADR